MKVSLITTVLNEENAVEEFLDSILNQTKKPNEFIIVDGGSIDNTYKILKKYAKKYKWIKIFQIKNVSIGKGRNYAIEKARNEIIACTDAGCILDRKWLEEITKPFEKGKIDVVIGIYKPYYTSDFEYFQGLIVVPDSERIFLNPARMSSRSIAFKKTIWQKVEGYPDLSVGEDTEFNLKLLKNNCKFAFARNAIVYWRMRKTWRDFTRQFFNYGIGDRKSKNLLKLKRNLFMIIGFWSFLLLTSISFFTKPVFFLVFLTIFFSYFLYCGFRLMLISKKLSGIYYGFLLTLIKRIFYILGVSFGK